MIFFHKKFSLVLVSLLVLLSATNGSAQKIDTVGTFSMTAYFDAYYAYYTDTAGPGNFSKFPSVSPRQNNPSLNIAQISMQYNAEKVRAMAVFHFGDLAASSWAPAPFNNIMEAHVGFRVHPKLWIDAGLFRTHFGTEYFLPSENITSSLSVGTFYEPFYESGLKVNFDPTKKLEINVFLLNGYNTFVENNTTKSLGLGVTYVLNDNSGIGYTGYYGDESVPGDMIKHYRIHNNVFYNYTKKKWKVQVGGDYCMQQNSDIATHTKTAAMYSALATVKYQGTSKCGIYARAEVFSDPEGYMSGVMLDQKAKMTGYKLTGYTLGLEYKPSPESYIRLEGRDLQMQEDQYLFFYDGNAYNARYEFMVNAGVTFDLIKNVLTKKGE